MNDRYLFKAKRKNWQELPKDEQWVTGTIMYIENKCMMLIEDEGNLLRVHYLDDEMWSADIYAIEVDESTICQCTGLKDKNENPIWENDICDRKEPYPEIVKYCNGDWTLDYSYAIHKETGGCYCNLGFYVEERKCVEVIGNIFDNPELLESEE